MFRHQLLRHRRRLRRPADAGHGQGVRHLGGDHRPVAAAQRAPRRHRPGHEGVPADGTRSERPPAVGLSPSTRVRGEPQTDHIDVYQMHHVDRATPWEEIWQAMERLVREGKISYVGSSNFAAWDVALAQCAASAWHFMGLTSEQSLYNLAVRTVEMS